jgi:hypothetical protein
VDGLAAEMALIQNQMRKVKKDLLVMRMRKQRKRRKRKRKRRRIHRSSSGLYQKMRRRMTLVTNLHPRNLVVLVDPRQVRMVKPAPTTRTMIENEIRSMPVA